MVAGADELEVKSCHIIIAPDTAVTKVARIHFLPQPIPIEKT